jgi:hypothetical protein
MSVHEKLMKARLNLQATKLEKTGHNKFAGYKYFELGDFLPSVQKILYDLKLSGYVSYLPDVAVLTITDIEDGTQIFINSPMATAALKGAHDIQNLGAVQTYLRRYLWVTAMEIVEHDILDASLGAEPPKPKAPVVKTPVGDIKPKVHTVMEGKVGDWQLKVDDSQEHWGQAVKAATDVCLSFADKIDDVNSIFRNNRVIYDKLKEEHADIYADIMEVFKAKKAELTKE